MLLDEFRAQFPITDERTYLITGAIAPASRPVRDALTAWLHRLTHDPLLNFDTWTDAAGELRSIFARLIGASPESIAITDGTSRAAAIAVDLVAELPGKNVLVDPTTYPSSLQPWVGRTDKRVVESRHALDADSVARLGAGDLAAVVVSHVAWQSGYRHDLRALAEAAHQQGGILMVDAAQSTGAVPIDVGVVEVDVLATTAMKWLYGVAGAGFLYVRPGLVGLPAPVADRLEPGVPALPSIAATTAALELLERVGVEQLARHIESLVTRCLEGLAALNLPVATPPDPRRRAGVIAVGSARAGELSAGLRRQGIDVMGRDEWGFLRVDPAGFTTAAEIDRFLDEIGRLPAKQGEW